jgi:esterase/lipase
LAFSIGGGVATVSHGHGHAVLMIVLLRLAGAIFWITANFSLRNAIEEHYNSAENIGLSLSGVMTFFFNVIYFQYHFDKIRAARLQQGAFAARA